MTAASKYSSCVPKALAMGYTHHVTLEAKGGLPGYDKALGKCVDKYGAAWPRLRAKAKGLGSTCDGPRFADNGDGTVTDRLTALQWEKKDDMDGVRNPDDPHDAR